MNPKLRELVEQLSPLAVDGSLNREITGIAYDSRRVTPGAIFVAIAGSNADGHDFIASAIDRGAVAVVCERNGFISNRVAKIKVGDSRQALARAAAAFYEHPSRRLQVIGITGTNGKTTVSFLVKRILEMSGARAGLIGTVRYEVGDREFPAQRTTPEALEVQQLMFQMARTGCRACVMEVSSHALQQDRVLGVEFDAAVFTNLTRDHLDYHGGMENYFQAKKRLFDLLRSGPKKGAAIINIDDRAGLRLAASGPYELQVTYGTAEKATVRGRDIRLHAAGSRLTVETGQGAHALSLPLIGRHNVYNALAAFAAGLALSVPAGVIVRALESAPQVPGRLEAVTRGQPFGVYVDYAHTEDALRNVLESLREVGSSRLLVAFGCGGGRDAGKRAPMGAAAAELANFTIITSDNPRRESSETIAAEIEAGYRRVRDDGYEVILDRRDAIQSLIRMARHGDTVLIAGKGHETYQEIDEVVSPFDDRIYAAETLAALGWRGAKDG